MKDTEKERFRKSAPTILDSLKKKQYEPYFFEKVEEARNNLERMFNLVSGMERHAGTLKNLTLKIKNLSKHVMLRIKERNNRREIKLQKQMYRARITPMLRREKKFISRLNTLKAIIGALILKADEALKKGQAILFINEFNKRRDNIVDTFKQITALEYTLRTLEGGLLKQIYIIEHPE